MMMGWQKKKSWELGFYHNIPLGGQSLSHDDDLNKKKNCEPGFCTKTSLPVFKRATNWVALVNEVKTRTSLLSQNLSRV